MEMDAPHQRLLSWRVLPLQQLYSKNLLTSVRVNPATKSGKDLNREWVVLPLNFQGLAKMPKKSVGCFSMKSMTNRT